MTACHRARDSGFPTTDFSGSNSGTASDQSVLSRPSARSWPVDRGYARRNEEQETCACWTSGIHTHILSGCSSQHTRYIPSRHDGTTHRPDFVRIISLPITLNFCHKSLLSSSTRHLLGRSRSEQTNANVSRKDSLPTVRVSRTLPYTLFVTSLSLFAIKEQRSDRKRTGCTCRHL